MSSPATADNPLCSCVWSPRICPRTADERSSSPPHLSAVLCCADGCPDTAAGQGCGSKGKTALFSLVGRLQGNKLGTCRTTKRTQTAASSSKAEEERLHSCQFQRNKPKKIGASFNQTRLGFKKPRRVSLFDEFRSSEICSQKWGFS